MTQDSLLLESLPLSLVAALRELPKRLLFRNEHLQMVLAGLARGQRLESFAPPMPVLLVVAYGRVWFEGPEFGGWLSEGREMRLEADVIHHLRADEETDLLFFIPTAKPLPSLAAPRVSCREIVFHARRMGPPESPATRPRSSSVLVPSCH